MYHWTLCFPSFQAVCYRRAERGAHAYMAREKWLSSLSPLVFTAAFEARDPLALNVLRTCARDLADQICIVVGDSIEETPGVVNASESVICFGGSLVGLDVYRKLVLDCFHVCRICG
ncbi:hypothetical protein BDP27DRAFT_1315314 [Rhodocollybia butyracea]|uniref:Uncharacterized protein n=1 Tax=Rhodocollybia butyracea TaxID=206335 RepID=A0A9P5Q6C0_9AGAR|nr:hypothetical protein BDP27DRAFT_1315314 [Rhodocollybia butyracea]